MASTMGLSSSKFEGRVGQMIIEDTGKEEASVDIDRDESETRLFRGNYAPMVTDNKGARRVASLLRAEGWCLKLSGGARRWNQQLHKYNLLPIIRA